MKDDEEHGHRVRRDHIYAVMISRCMDTCDYLDVMSYFHYYDAPLALNQAKEIIETAKNGNNRAAPHLIKKYVHLISSLKFYESIGYTMLTDMVSDEWFDSVKRIMALLDIKRCKGYYEINVEVEEW